MNIENSFNNLTDTNITIYSNGSKAISKEKLKNTFITYYQNHFKTISLLIEDDKKPIDDIYVNLAIIKEEKEEDIKDKSKLLDRDKIINSYEEIYKPKEPIAIEELIEKSSKYNSAKALIYGKAGIGKTTFCKYITYRWAKGELYGKFDNVVYIALREWKEDGLESIIKKIYFEEKHKDQVIEIDQSKTLFLFDGYDELSESSLLHGAIKKYNLQNYIITSRPYGYRKSDFDVNEVFETIGFTDENVRAYIDKFFEEQSHKTNLQNFLKQNINIKHIAYIPLMLEMICSLWREKAKTNQSFLSPMTMTELYREVIEYIFSEYSETNKTDYIQEKEEEIFDYLGKIAFEGLKKQVIVLDKSIIEEKKEFFVDYVLKTGFLKSDRKHRNPLMNSYEFPHLTFQEYFSALYVSKLPKEEINEVIREYKFYPYMQVFFAFLGGLIEDKEFLFREVESEPKDAVGYYSMLLTINLLEQIKRDELGKDRIEFINLNLLKLIKKYYIHETLLKKLQFINEFIDDVLVDALISYTQNDTYVKEACVISLATIGRSDEKIINILIQHIKDKTFGKRGEVAKLLALIDNRSDYLISDILNEFISDKTVSLRDKLGVIESFISLNKVDNNIIYLLLDYMQDNTTNKEQGYQFIDNIITIFVSINRKDDEFINIIINFLKDETIDFSIRRELARSLFSINNRDNKFIDILMEFIKNDNIHLEVRGGVAVSLASMGRSDNIIIHTLINCMKINLKFMMHTMCIPNNDIVVKRVVLYGLDDKLGVFSDKESDTEFFKPLLDPKYERDKKGKISNELTEAEKQDDVFIDELISSIINEENNIQNNMKLLNSIDRKDSIFIYKLLSIVKNSNVNNRLRDEFIILLTSINRNDDEFVKILEKLIKDPVINGKDKGSILFRLNEDIIKALSFCSKNNHNAFEILINLSQDQSIGDINRFNIMNSLLLTIKDNKFVNTFINLVNNQAFRTFKDHSLEHLIAKISFKDNDIFKKINVEKSFSSFELDVIIKNSSTESICKAYENKFISQELFSRHMMYHQLPLYIKKDKLCTIFENREIKFNPLKRDVEQLTFYQRFLNSLTFWKSKK